MKMSIEKYIHKIKVKGKYGVYRNFEYRCLNRKFIFN